MGEIAITPCPSLGKVNWNIAQKPVTQSKIFVETKLISKAKVFCSQL